MAQNLKVVSNHGHVTLRGLVTSAREEVRLRLVEAAVSADNAAYQLDVVR